MGAKGHGEGEGEVLGGYASKYFDAGSGADNVIQFGEPSAFYEGLDGLLGPPNPNLREAMQHDHCAAADSLVRRADREREREREPAAPPHSPSHACVGSHILHSYAHLPPLVARSAGRVRLQCITRAARTESSHLTPSPPPTHLALIRS